MSSLAPSIERLERVNRQDLALATVARLAKFIAGLEPGARLPTEKELCERLGVGRSTLREAVGSLAFIGAVQTRQGSGTYVGTQEDAPVEKLIGLALMLQRSSVSEIVEVRRVLEMEAVRLAAERHTEADREALTAVMDAMRECAGEPARASGYDMQYHLLLARASHNSALAHFLNGMRALLGKWIGLAVNAPPIVGDIVREHDDILRAVFRHDPERAGAYMLIHLTNAAERLFAVVGKDHSAANYISLVLSSAEDTL
jgi:GntR family transcriptional repressor for pyruvate dehydrogenase complex